MNKKVIALIIVVILIAIIVGGVLIFTSNNENQSNTNQQTANNSEGGTENNNINTAMENSNVGENIVNDAEKNTNNTDDNIEETGKVLVLYFSHTGNTETVANFIHEAVGGDIVKLETVEPYTDDYNELLDIAQEEQRNNARPELSTKIDNIDEYDTIFLGYPNWWADCPMAIYSFLDEYDLSGKTIAPFVTSGGSGLSGTPSKIQAEEPNAEVTEGLAVSGSNARNSQSDVQEWLSEIGF